MTEYVEAAKIAVRSRQRELDQAHVVLLKTSIASLKGLLSPIVIAMDPAGIFLVAGAHRREAMMQLHKEGTRFTHNGREVPLGTIPCVNVLELSAADLMETELEENVLRKEITWQDRTRALAAIHKLRKEENPSQSFLATASEIVERGGGEDTGATRALRREVSNAMILSQHLDKPSIAKARNATEALGILYKEENAALEAELIRRRGSSALASGPQIKVLHGDFTLILPSMPEGQIDLITADLPYGINADKGGFRQRTVEHHNYEDTKERAQDLLLAIIREGFRVCKPRANLFVFGDIDLFPMFKQAAASMGWVPFRTPIVWRKSESEGLAPWGREGFRRTYEMIFFATKGKRGLHQSPVDILDEKRVSRHLRRYGPEKPAGLMAQLLEAATLPGDLVLDPCCGSGATLIAARHTRRNAIGIELDESAYNLSVVAAERDPVEMEEQLEQQRDVFEELA